MPVRKGNAVWRGNLKGGKGRVQTETGTLDADYSFSSRFEEGTGTNPEELIAAAHAGCFSMAFSADLENAGYPPDQISTEDRVHIEKVGEGFTITRIEIVTEGVVPGIDDDAFQRLAEGAKKNCPVSRALAGTEFVLTASLKAS